MERELWIRLRAGLRRVPRWWPRNALYSNTQILAVLLWAAMHDRPISWACRRRNWPAAAWRRRLPDQSTMSRRLRDPRLIDDLRRLIACVHRASAPDATDSATTRIVDGRALPVSNISGDADAVCGWGTRQYARGYKLHAIIDSAHRLIDFEVHGMNTPESKVAAEMIERGPTVAGGELLADAGYDSNALYRACEARGMQLLAPRRRPGTGLGWVPGGHAASRVHAIRVLEDESSGWSDRCRRERVAIERFFGTLACASAGLASLPPWVRRLHRVRSWVGAKLAINAARRAEREAAKEVVAA